MRPPETNRMIETTRDKPWIFITVQRVFFGVFLSTSDGETNPNIKNKKKNSDIHKKTRKTKILQCILNVTVASNNKKNVEPTKSNTRNRDFLLVSTDCLKTILGLMSPITRRIRERIVRISSMEIIFESPLFLNCILIDSQNLLCTPSKTNFIPRY